MVIIFVLTLMNLLSHGVQYEISNPTDHFELSCLMSENLLQIIKAKKKVVSIFEVNSLLAVDLGPISI